MKEYIDREALLKTVSERLVDLRTEYGDYDSYTDGYDECVDRIIEAHAADVIKPICCEDCKYSRELDRKSAFESRFPEECVFCMEFIEPMWRNDFCSRAKRKEDAE